MPNTGTSGLFFLLGQAFVPVPLISVSAKATVIHCVGQVKLTQVYTNLERNPIEITYFFPTNPLGAVTGFVAEVSGRTLRGVVKPNEEAERDYEEAVRNGKVALLGSEITGDTFKLQLGNLKPGSSANVKITYTTEVRNDPGSNSVRFVLPTTIAPRYVPPASSGRAAENISSIQYSSESMVPISIRVAAFIQGEIRDIRSLSGHNITVESSHNDLNNPTWCTAIIGLTTNTTEMDRDFVLLITPVEAVMRPRVYSEILDNSACYMLHLIPNFSIKSIKAEIIVLVDRSGSMLGTSISLASSALSLLLHSLPVDCYFNILGFGSGFEPLFPESVKYGENTLLAANKYCESMDAGMGGTEILAPLQYIFKRKPVSKRYLRQLFVLTDGEVGNTAEVIDLVWQNASSTRVFAIGIGSSCCRELVEGIAKASQGTATYVERDESIQTATLAQLKNALQPALNNVKIEWQGLPEVYAPTLENAESLFRSPTNAPTFLQSPRLVPPVFAGSQLIVFGMFRNFRVKPSGVKISAVSPDGILTFEVDIHTRSSTFHQGMTGNLHLLGWIKRTRELETFKAADWGDEIVRISVKNGFATSLTSFVVVDESNDDKVVYSTRQKRQVAQYEVVEKVISLARDCPPRRCRSNERARKLVWISPERSCHPPVPDREKGAVMMLCRRQNFDGSFSPEMVTGAMQINTEVVTQAGKIGWNLKAFSTALAIIFLREKHPEERDIWELIVEKADAWLMSQPMFTEMLQKARITINQLD